MNERYKLIERECWHATDSDPYALFDVKKFALLMVKECAGIVEDAVNHREPASTYADKITKHFGVEE